MANARNADLFVSVHLNAAADVVERGGVTTFVPDVDNDRSVRRLAARENGTGTSHGDRDAVLGRYAGSRSAAHALRLAHYLQRSALVSGCRYLPWPGRSRRAQRDVR
jgi:N-acetylmuramoyl-L-alanine amidase